MEPNNSNPYQQPGNPQPQTTPQPTAPGQQLPNTPHMATNSQPAAPTSEGKSYLATWLFSWILGPFGADRFYLGYIGTGILKLITFGGFGIWYLIDLVRVLAGTVKDKTGRPLEGRAEHLKLSVILTVIFWILGVVSNIILVLTGAYSHIFNNPINTTTQTSSNYQYASQVTTLTNDLDTMRNDIDSGASTSTVQTDCQTMQTDVQQAEGVQAGNNATNKAYTSVVTDFGKLGQDCNNIVSLNFSQASINQFNTDLGTTHNAILSLRSKM